MYNGVGLSTVRGSGTSGYVQRNAGQVRRSRGGAGRGFDPWKKRGEDDAATLAPPPAKKEVNPEILEHERKRKIEVRVMEAAEEWEDEGLSAKDIEERCSKLRKRLVEDAKSGQGQARIFSRALSRRDEAKRDAELHSMHREKRRWSPRSNSGDRRGGSDRRRDDHRRPDRPRYRDEIRGSYGGRNRMGSERDHGRHRPRSRSRSRSRERRSHRR